MSSGLKIVFGGVSLGNPGNFQSDEQAKELLNLVKELKIDTIDSAQLYGESEATLGRIEAGKDFTIDTKAVGGFQPGSGTKDGVIEGAKSSIDKLKIPQVDIFYLHSPDATVPLADTLAGINEVYKLGLFKRFGLSNYKAEDVQKAYDICKENNYVLPTVYQGNYSPVARLQETLLFPTLRKLNIAFYAYSPLAGGFLAKSKQDVIDGKGRFDTSHPIGQMYANLYARPAYLEALAKWEAIAQKEGTSKADLAYRWVSYNSALKPEHGDAIIVGASSLKQLKETVTGLAKGPLSAEAVKGIDEIWESVKHEAPLDNYNSHTALQKSS